MTQRIIEVRPKPVCRHYRHGTCKYGRRGLECSFSHPKTCLKFKMHGYDSRVGCKEDRWCKAFHPIMCTSSLNKKVCTNTDCRYPHINGTRRTDWERQSPQAAAEQSNNYTEDRGNNTYRPVDRNTPAAEKRNTEEN